MKRLICHFLAAAALFTGAPFAPAQFIYVNLSCKVVLNPANGARPSTISDAAIDAAIERMNQLQAPYFRGFRFRRVDAINNVGGMGDSTGPSRWYSVNFFDEDNGDRWKDEMETAARNGSAYRWNDNAINLYFVDGICGGKCSFPTGDRIIVLGGCDFSMDEAVQLHEIGHYFDLRHTHEGGSCCNRTQNPGCSHTFGDDGLEDTIDDIPCGSQDDLAQHEFGRSYASLTAAEQVLVDDTFFNIMSYHNKTPTGQNVSRLTEQQLDQWTDTANRFRTAVTSARTRFVATSGGCINVDGNLNCRWNGSFFEGGPFSSVSSAVSAASVGDIVLIGPGAYNQQFTITKAVTLRATRRGPISIGTSIVR